MRLSLIDGKVTDSMYVVNKSPFAMMYLLPSKVTCNGPMQVPVAVSQDLNIGIGNNWALD